LTDTGGYGPASYGDAFADIYDEWYGESPAVASSDIDATVQCLVELANNGRVLELGVGTGRIALPLVAAGVDVVGLDASAKMLDQLAAKPDGSRVTTVCADMSTGLPEGPFSLVFVAINTFFNLTSHDQQLTCMKGVAERLTDDGVFVIEAFVPDLDRYGSGLSLRTVDLDHVVLAASHTDIDRQLITGQYVELRNNTLPRLRPFQICYQSPDQLDQMAAVAGLTLVNRWENWSKSGFKSRSSHHVSVFRADRKPRMKES
jgi:SAM-dependent methyltransferase